MTTSSLIRIAGAGIGAAPPASRTRSAMGLVLCLLSWLGLTAAPAAAATPATVYFSHHSGGAPQTWRVPAGVTSATFTLYGAQGGASSGFEGGWGGMATATVAVTPGEVLQVNVGGKGGASGAGGLGGDNGGGAGGVGTKQFAYQGAGGGGASDIRRGTRLADRIIIAGGGGGPGGLVVNGGLGGLGGGFYGTNGMSADGRGTVSAGGGARGVPYAGGAGGTSVSGAAGANGGLGQGGNGGNAVSGSGGGGGGGGLYGGGGGAGAASLGGGGGGGGGAFGPAGVTTTVGARFGDGQVIITWLQPAAATVTQVTSSANPSELGQQVRFTATVSSAEPSAFTPTGAVQFKVDGSNLGGYATMIGGVAVSPAIASLGVGAHTITAEYVGAVAPEFAPSTGTLVQQVNRARTTTVLSASANPARAGEQITYTAAVSPVAPGAGTPTGTVWFRYDGDSFGEPVALVDGVATLPATDRLAAGSHQITAEYSGDAGFQSSMGSMTMVVDAVISSPTGGL